MYQFPLFIRDVQQFNFVAAVSGGAHGPLRALTEGLLGN